MARFYDAGAPLSPDAAFAPDAVWQLYDFQRFHFGFVAQRNAGPRNSFKFFDVWQVLGNLWVLSVWICSCPA